MSRGRTTQPRSARVPAGGRIITFYSYKGGTGRSMAVANVAWLLASSGYRVMLIDWDLEAPGLHRYFHPLLRDPEMERTEGLIEFFVAFAEAARSQPAVPSPRRGASARAKAPGRGKKAQVWFTPYARLDPYAVSIDWPFTGDGRIDLVPAGLQGPGYGERAALFDWAGFYDDLGGAVFLESVKTRLRAEYDYVLIDSRTGLGDIAGISTVQMPDDLVVCFTLNNQSIRGASAVAESAFAQRRLPSGEPGLRVWPVPTRVETSEKERADAARALVEQSFSRFVARLPRSRRRLYWKSIEVPYVPYFALEEILASFADRFDRRLSVLDSFATLAGHLCGRPVKARKVDEVRRREVLGRFTRRATDSGTSGRGRTGFYLSYKLADQDLAAAVAAAMNRALGPGTVVWDHDLLSAGDDWHEKLTGARRDAAVVLVLVTPSWVKGFGEGYASKELLAAMRAKQTVVPLFADVPWEGLAGITGAKALLRSQGIKLSRNVKRPLSPEAMDQLGALLRSRVERTEAETDPDDPQKGRWGGRSTANGRRLAATVSAVSRDWFSIHLTVKPVRQPGGGAPRPLSGVVRFHVHPSFTPSVYAVPVEDGTASLELAAYGAFTVGATADDGETRLELDLARLRGVPRTFAIR